VHLRNKVRLALYTGDFTAAERALTDLEHAAAGSTAEANHFGAFMLLLTYLEEGANARAIAEAEEYSRKMEAWSLDLGESYARGFALAELVRAGKMTAGELRARMDEWARASVARLPQWRQAHRWVMRHASVETPEEARDALSLAPPELLPYYVSLSHFRGTIGRVLALAGETEKALPYLKAEASFCGAEYDYDSVYDSFHWLRQMEDRLVLGQALERSGEREGACAQYAIILDRWGHAKPRSVTADKAKERAKALGCNP
jgi:serine/threonine-protein kinase